MKSLLFLISIFIINLSFAQEGEVTITKDPRVDKLVKKQGEVVPPANQPQITGYRLQIMFDSDKQKIDQARVQFLSKYNKIEAYVTYSAPNYFLRVGDFRTELEAEKIKAELEQQFPTCFVIKEKINLPKISY